MTLAAHVLERPGASRLVLVHGFTQNSRCWSPVLEQLAADFTVIAVDAPGHGTSPALHDHADPGEAARLIVEVGGRAHYLGYSMGGRLCLRAACDHPDMVASLTLVGATPGLPDAEERARRRRDDEQLADQLQLEGLGPFLDHWLALPLFAGLNPAAQARTERLTNRVEGVATSLRRCGTGNQLPLWDRLADLDMPVLALAGARDEKFAAVAQAMVAAINAPRAAGRAPGRAELAFIEHAGHTAHLEAPRAFLELVVPWLAARKINP
ncbi:MAG: alpha/beta fold hydrolase [Acidimicrobiales bacterium]